MSESEYERTKAHNTIAKDKTSNDNNWEKVYITPVRKSVFEIFSKRKLWSKTSIKQTPWKEFKDEIEEIASILENQAIEDESEKRMTYYAQSTDHNPVDCIVQEEIEDVEYVEKINQSSLQN